MDKNDILEATAQFARQTLEGEGSGHDWWHIHRVRENAMAIGRAEGADLFVVELAALLHDIADWKFHDGDAEAGPRVSGEWLTEQGVEAAVIDHVCDIIRKLSFKGAGVNTDMPTLEGRVVQDADRLEAIGAMGVARCFAYGGHKSRPIYDPESEPTPHGSFEEYKKTSGSTINHFYEKLLLLKDRMQTPTGRRLAEGRHAFMESFLKQFFAECEGKA